MNDLAVVIVSYNTKVFLGRCLVSVTGQMLDGSIGIVVVDNASSDGSVDMVKERFPSVRLIENRDNVGFATANNQAITLVEARYILMLNSDTVVLPGCLKSMMDFLQANPQVGIVGAELLNPDGSLQARGAPFPRLRNEVLQLVGIRGEGSKWQRREDSGPRAVDWVGGACLMARREAVLDVGLLDTSFFMYSEETDWCYRMKKHGWQVFDLPAAKVIHFGGQSAVLDKPRSIQQLYQSKLKFFRKHQGLTVAICLAVALVLTSLAKIALLTLAWPVLPKWKRSPEVDRNCARLRAVW